MFNQFHSPWYITLLVVAIVLASCAARAAAIGPSELPLVESAFSAQTPAGSSSPKIAVEQPGQKRARSNAAMDPLDADAGESNPSTKSSDTKGTPTPSAQAAGGDSVESTQRLNNNANETISAPARALFARSQNLDVTQPISVSQLLVLEQKIEPGTLLKIMAVNALGSWYQTTDPDGPNYVALIYPETGAWTAVVPESARGLQRSLIFELSAGSFSVGQTLEIRYSRLQSAKALEAPLSLPVAMQLPGAVSWQVLPGEQQSFMPGPAIALQISVDQQVQVDESFDLSVQPIDALGNAAESSIDTFDLILNNRLLQEINLKDNGYIAIGLALKTLGRHQFSARSPAGGLQSKATTVWALPEPPLQLIWTDFSERSLAALMAELPISDQYRQNAASSLPSTYLDQQSTSGPRLLAAQTSSRPLMPDLIESGRQKKVSGPKDSPSEAAFTGIEPRISSPKLPENGLSTVIQPIEVGGQSMTLVVGDTTLGFAQPELTTDRRRKQVDLVEQLSGPSGHQWLSHYFATLGHAFGITSRKTSFQPRAHQQGPQTAIVVRPGQTWLEALANGQTFVTSGTMAGLSFSINGTQFGRVPHQAQRTAEIAVTSLERPLWARIFRNGELLVQLPFKSAGDRAAAIAGPETRSQGQLFLYLESDSKPFAPGVTTPRNGREWLGQIRLQELIMTESHADYLNGLVGNQLSESSDQRQLDFLTWTHGTGALMQLDLKQSKTGPTEPALRRDSAIDLKVKAPDDAGETRSSTVVTLELAEGYEDLTYFDANRPPAATPSFNEQFDLEALRGQGIRRTLSVDGYLDQISLWYVDAEPDLPIETAPPTHQMTHLDRMGGRPGDYYTCQVLLRDGTSLYSSPIFVGGFDPRW